MLEMEEKLRKFNELLAYARKNSSFYNYLPEKPLENMAQLAQIPTICEADLAASGQSMLCCAPKKLRRMVTMETSGTTGEKKRLAFTEADLETTVSFFADGMSKLCARGERAAIFMPGSNPDGLCDLLSRGLTRFGAIPGVFGILQDYEAGADFCRRFKPHILVGIPGQIRRLALTVPELRPHSVLLSADYAAQELRDTIERIWHCRVFLHYGSTESGLGCAVEIPGSRVMKLRPESILETLPDGELVLTTLSREALPLIRYRTGDYGKVLSNGDLAAVYGRICEHRKPVPIYTLDALLFGEDSLLDYRAALKNQVLTLECMGSPGAGLERIKERFPDLEIRCSAVDAFTIGSRGKRSVKMQ